MFRSGEVIRKVDPTSQDSRSKLFYEYDVLVSHYENEAFTTKIYRNCFLINSLAGLADKSHFTLRASDSNDPAIPGNGSKVLVLCLDGNETQTFIVGGIQAEADPDDVDKGHHFYWEFNGVVLEVNDDGSWSITNNGKTNIKGEADKDRDTDGSGTKVSVEANGNFTIQTPKGQVIKLDNTDGSITISSDQQVTIKTNQATIDAKQISLGGQATSPYVKGDILVGILTQAFTAIGSGLTNGVSASALAAASTQLETALSANITGQ
jgi:phage baseplate assembly protein gpV